MARPTCYRGLEDNMVSDNEDVNLDFFKTKTNVSEEAEEPEAILKQAGNHEIRNFWSSGKGNHFQKPRESLKKVCFIQIPHSCSGTLAIVIVPNIHIHPIWWTYANVCIHSRMIRDIHLGKKNIWVFSTFFSNIHNSSRTEKSLSLCLSLSVIVCVCAGVSLCISSCSMEIELTKPSAIYIHLLNPLHVCSSSPSPSP